MISDDKHGTQPTPSSASKPNGWAWVIALAMFILTAWNFQAMHSTSGTSTWPENDPKPVDYWFITTRQAGVGDKTSAISFSESCLSIGKNGFGFFAETMIRDDEPQVFIGELPQSRDASSPETNACLSKKRPGSTYAPCATDGPGNCMVEQNSSSTSNENVIRISSSRMAYESHSLVIASIFILILLVAFTAFLTGSHSKGRPSSAFADSGYTPGILFGLSGLLWVRFIIATNSVIYNPEAAAAVYVTGLQSLLIPTCTVWLMQSTVSFRRRMWIATVVVLVLACATWTHLAKEDPLVGHMLTVRGSQIWRLLSTFSLDGFKSNTPATTFLIEVVLTLSLPIFLLVKKVNFGRLDAKLSGFASKLSAKVSRGSLATFYPGHGTALIFLVLAVSSLMSAVAGSTKKQSWVQLLPYLPIILAVGSLCWPALFRTRSRMIQAALLPSCIACCVLGTLFDTGTSLIAIISLILAVAVTRLPAELAKLTVSTPNTLNSEKNSVPTRQPLKWLHSSAVIVSTILLASLLVMVAFKGYLAYRMSPPTHSNDTELTADERYEFVDKKASAVSFLNDCSVANTYVDASAAKSNPDTNQDALSAEAAARLDECYMRHNYEPATNTTSLFEAHWLLNEKTRLYAWLVGQPLDRVWSKTALENMGGYMQGLANAVPKPGAELFLGDKRVPTVTEIGPRGDRSGFDYEWMVGFSLIRPLGWAAVFFVLVCYWLLYRCVETSNAQAQIFIAALGFASFWAMAQTQGIFPLFGFSTPLLTFTSLGRDFMPNMLNMIVLLICFGAHRRQEVAP